MMESIVVARSVLECGGKRQRDTAFAGATDAALREAFESGVVTRSRGVFPSTPRCFATLTIAWFLALLVSPFSAHAHTQNTSYLRALVSKGELELRFTFDLATLYRIKRIDANGDATVSRAEAESAAAEIADFLSRTVSIEMNGIETGIGAFQSLVWPPDAGEVVAEKDYGTTLVHLTFKQQSKPVIQDVYILYEVFGQLGDAHRVVADIEQEEQHLEVVFNQLEPDYVYDTFWREDPGERTEGAQTIPDVFQAGVKLTWASFGLPLLLLAAGSLLPRKLPVIAALAVLLWYVRDFFIRMNDLSCLQASPADFPVVAAMGGMGAAMMICALVILPAALFLRQWCTRCWCIAIAWAALVFGALELTNRTLMCRGPGAASASETG